MEEAVIIPVSSLRAMQKMLLDARESSECAVWACGAVFVAIEEHIQNGENKTTVNQERGDEE